LAQTLNNFVHIKGKALGHRKKTVKQVVSSGTPRQFHKFLSWFKVDVDSKVDGLKLMASRRWVMNIALASALTQYG